MSTLRTSGRIVAAAISAATFLSPVFAEEALATGEGDSGVVVESSVDQSNAIMLPPAAVVGQSAVSVTTFELSITATGVQVDLAIRLDMTSEVTELTAEGGYVAVTTIDKVELTQVPPGIDVSTLGYDALTGVQFQQTVDATGKTLSTELLNVESLTDATRASAEGFTGNLQSAQFVYPSEPVGLGAKWTAELEVATEGFAVPATYTYEITDIADGRYTIAVAYDSTFDTTIEGQAATGTLTGLGTVVGSVDNPLAISVTLGQTIDATSGGVAVSVIVGIDVQAAAR